MDDVPILIPRSIADACATLATNPDATVLAGGTDLMVEINAGHRRPTAVVSLGALDELASWQELGRDVPPPTLVLGAGLTYTALMSGRLAERLPALAAASRTVGSPQIRNAGTLGGNLGTASPAGDTLPVLAALDATVDLVSSSGERSLRLEEFITGPKLTARRSDELIAAVRFPAPEGPQQFLKVGTRNAMVIAAVSLAAVVDRPTRSIRLALGSVGPTSIRAHDAEAWLADRLDWEMTTAPDPTLLAELARRVSASARPIDDHRSTADYRRHAAGVLAVRAVRRMWSTDQRANDSRSGDRS